MAGQMTILLKYLVVLLVESHVIFPSRKYALATSKFHYSPRTMICGRGGEWSFYEKYPVAELRARSSV